MEHYERSTIELNAEQKTALAMMLRGDSIFLTGSAGTGKSTLIKEFMKQFRGNAVVVAPTGVAALNANGQTIHSFFFLPPSDNVYDENSLKPIPYPAVSKKLRQVDCIVIDEISMCRSDMFWAIDYRLKKVMNSSKPFGGKQIIACGDFFQLPPVVTSAWVQEVLDESFNIQTVFLALKYCLAISQIIRFFSSSSNSTITTVCSSTPASSRINFFEASP